MAEELPDAPWAQRDLSDAPWATKSSPSVGGEVLKAAQRGPLEGADMARALGMGPAGWLEKGTYQPAAALANYVKPGLLPSHLLPNVSDVVEKIAPGYGQSIAPDPRAPAIPRYAGALTEVGTNPMSWAGPGGALLKTGMAAGTALLGQGAEDVAGEPGRIASSLLLPLGIGARSAYKSRAARAPLDGEVIPPPPPGPPPPPPAGPTIEHVATPRDGLGIDLLPPQAPHSAPPSTRGSAGAAATPGFGPLQGMSRNAIERVREHLAQEGFTRDEVGRNQLEQRLDEMSQHQFLGELTPGMENRLGGLATYSGASRSEIYHSVTQRGREAPQRLRALFNRTIGDYQDMQDLQRSMEIERGQVATPLYDAFRRLPIPPTAALNALIPRLEAAGAFANARRLAAVQGRPWQDVFTHESGVPQQFPTGETWDLVKRAIDTQIETSINEGSRNWTRVYTGLKNDLLDALDNHPDQRIGEAYRQARDAHATPTELLTAQELGRQILTDNIHREELPYLTASYSAAQMRNLRSGLRAALEDRAASSRSPARTTNALLDAVLPESSQQKLRWALGDGAADELIAGAQHEEAMHGAPTRIIHGSPTGARQEAKAEFAPKPGFFQTATMADIPHGVVQAGLAAGAKGVKALQARSIANAEARAAQWRHELAQIKMLQGSERDAALRELLGPPEGPGGQPLKRQVIETGRSGRPTKTAPLPIGNEQQVLEKGYEKTTQKVPGPSGHTNPLPVPDDYAAAVNRKVTRNERGANIGAPSNPAVRLEKGVYVGNVTPQQWLQRTEKTLTPDEITKARQWYKEALGTYEQYFGKDKGAAMLGAWMMANQNATPSFAQLSATRALEQYVNKTGEFAPKEGPLRNPEGGLAHDKLTRWWDAITSGDLSKLGQGGSGQKIYDFIDSALQKNTRTFYGDDPRAGAPAVADVHSLRDMGMVDDPLHNWVRETYGDKAANALKPDTERMGGQKETKYEWAADKMRRITDWLNKRGYMGGDWTPAEMQAVGWTSMSKLLGRKAETSTAAIEANIRNLSYELDFGEGAPYHAQFPEWQGLSGEQKTAVSKAVLPAVIDFAKQMTGAHEFARVEGLGGWHELTNPSYKSRLIASPEVAADMADMIGYLGQQTKIFGYRAINSGNRLGVTLYGEGLKDQSSVAKLWNALVERHPEFAAGFSPSVNANGVHGMEVLLDKGGARMAARVQQELVPAIDQLAHELGLGDIDVRDFRAAEESSEHDWTRDPSGSSYLQRLGARYGPDLQQRLELFKREELEPRLQQEIARARGAEGNAGEAGARPERGGASGAGSADEASRVAAQVAGPHQPLTGLPQHPIEIAGQHYVPGPLATAHDVARDYMRASRLPYDPPKTYAPVDEARARRIAQAFDDMKHDPDNPRVKAAYTALARETIAQWKAIEKTGLKIEWIKEGEGDPYAVNPRLAVMDVAQNNHLWVFPTDQGFGSGPEAAAAMKNNPLLADAGLVIGGRRALVNDVFRIVHDYFGHAKDGVGFRAGGEENAWRSHAAMYSPLARAAMTSETRGQNSWVNYGPHGAFNRTASGADTRYAPQKVGLMPEWTWKEGSGRERPATPRFTRAASTPMLRAAEKGQEGYARGGRVVGPAAVAAALLRTRGRLPGQGSDTALILNYGSDLGTPRSGCGSRSQRWCSRR